MNSRDNNSYNRDFIYTCPSKVFNDPNLNINELKIYMLIRSFMDTTGIAYPSNEWIAEHLGINSRNTINNINKLIKKGYIERIFDKNGQRFLRIKTTPMPEPIPDEEVSSATGGVASDRGGCLLRQGGGVASDTQLDQSNIISNKNIKEREKKREKETDRTFISDNFSPNESHELLALENRIDLIKEKESFIDYYKAHGKKMVNWDACFSNWLRRSLSFNKKIEKKEHPVTASIREFKEDMKSREFMSFLK